MKAWHATLVGITLALTLALPALAEAPPKPSRSLPDLMLLFPNSAQLPAGMVLEDEGSRSAAEIAAGFPDPDDAADVLQQWGWSSNAFRVYVADGNAEMTTPTRLEISIHQFSTNSLVGCAACGASYAFVVLYSCAGGAARPNRTPFAGDAAM